MNRNTPEDPPDLSDLTIDSSHRSPVSSFRKRFFWITIIFVICTAAAFVVIRLVMFKPLVIEAVKPVVRNPGQQVTVLTASGYVTPRRRATIASKITGRITALYVDEGMAVTQDQILAQLDDSEAQDQVRTARADLEVAKASIAETKVSFLESERTRKRIEELHRQHMASDQQLDEAQSTVDVLKARIQLAEKSVEASKARLDLALQNLENYTIIAPFPGIVVSKDAHIGEMVSPVSGGGGFTRTGIVTIVDMESLEIEVDVNESYIARVSDGQQADAVLDAYPEWHIPAHVRTIIPTADRQKATVKVRLTFNSLDPKILPDMGIKVSFLNPAEIQHAESQSAIILPKSCIKTVDGTSFVFVIEETTVEKRTVAVKQNPDNTVSILSGLTGSEQIASTNLNKLEDGMKVKLSSER